MKTATKNLEEDHVHILKLIDVMKSVTSSEKPDIKHIEEIIVIIRNYADGLHHTKEETLLFPALAQKGFTPEQGPVAVMLHEHNTGRIFVKGIADNLQLYKQGNSEAINEIYRNMSGYAELLSSHIARENNILFRLADRYLSQNEQETLLNQFEKIDHNGIAVSDYVNQISGLAKFYEV